jgi:hypothetical protein
MLDDACPCHEVLQRSASLATRLHTIRTALVRNKARPRTAAESVAQLRLGTTVHWRSLHNELLGTASSLAEMGDGLCLDDTRSHGTSCCGGTGRGKRVSTRRTSAGKHQRVDDHECDRGVRTETSECRHADQASARDPYRRRWPNGDVRALHCQIALLMLLAWSQRHTLLTLRRDRRRAWLRCVAAVRSGTHAAHAESACRSSAST